MAKETSDITLSPEQLATAIGDAVGKALAANGPRRRLTFGEYKNRGGYNAFHPTKATEKTLNPRRMYSQNGFNLHNDSLHDKEIELLNKITHSGRYINRIVEVIVSQNGADQEVVEIRFPCKTPDQRIEMKGLARNFIDMLEQITTTQNEEREEAEVVEEAKKEQRRKFGEGKASREAREKAGV